MGCFEIQVLHRDRGMQIKKSSDYLRLATRFQADERGIALVLMVLVLPLIIGFAALALDFGYTLVRTRQMQVAADAAAYSGATAILAGFDPSNYSRYSDEVYSSAAAAGFIDRANGITVTPSYNQAATTINGFQCSTASCVSVTISEQRNLSLYSFFNRINSFSNPSGNLSYSVSATALVTISNQYCMLATANSNKNMVGAVTIQGNVIISSPDCGIADNSRNASAFQTIGSSFTLDTPVTVVGGWTYNGNPTQFSVTYGTEVLDPYLSATDFQNALKSYPSDSGVTLSAGACPVAGVHYRSISINGSTCSLSGIYYFDSIQTFKNVDWSGNNSTIVIGPTGGISAGANASLKISAPTTGPYAGIAIAGLSSNEISFQGNPNFDTQFGAIYWPNGPVTLQGTPSNICLQVIADSINLAGNSGVSNFNQNCIANQYQLFRKIVQMIR